MLPVAGIRVLDLTRLLPGAYATSLLVDLGADVLKVEDPRGGDGLRVTPPYTAPAAPPAGVPGVPAVAAAIAACC